MDPLEALASSAGAGVATAGVNQLFANYNRSKDMAAQKDLQENAQRLATQAQRDSAANMKEAFQKAGLSTALLSNANFTPAIGSAPSAPQKNVTVGMPVSEFVQLGLMNAQKENIEAQTDRLEADTEKLNSENLKLNRDLDKVRQHDSAVLNEYKKQYPKEWAEIVKRDFEGDEEKAAAAATSGYLEGKLAGSDSLTKIKENLVREKVADIAKHPEIVKATANMPVYQKQKIQQEYELMAQQIDESISRAGLLDSQKDLTDEEVKKVGKEIDKIVKETERIASEKFRNYAVGSAAIVGSVGSVAKAFLSRYGLGDLAKSITTSTKSSSPILGPNGKPVSETITRHSGFPIAE